MTGFHLVITNSLWKIQISQEMIATTCSEGDKFLGSLNSATNSSATSL